jgi:hypothetical protein
MQCEQTTICKVTVNGKLTYELWHNGKQYHGFESSEKAIEKFNQLTKEK